MWNPHSGISLPRNPSGSQPSQLHLAQEANKVERQAPANVATNFGQTSEQSPQPDQNTDPPTGKLEARHHQTLEVVPGPNNGNTVAPRRTIFHRPSLPPWKPEHSAPQRTKSSPAAPQPATRSRESFGAQNLIQNSHCHVSILPNGPATTPSTSAHNTGRGLSSSPQRRSMGSVPPPLRGRGKSSGRSHQKWQRRRSE